MAGVSGLNLYSLLVAVLGAVVVLVVYHTIRRSGSSPTRAHPRGESPVTRLNLPRPGAPVSSAKRVTRRLCMLRRRNRLASLFGITAQRKARRI
jgi:hypothetical protein